MSALLVDDLAQRITEIACEYPDLHPRRMGAAITAFLSDQGHDFGEPPGGSRSQEVIDFVERTDPDNAMDPHRLAELIVAEFRLDEEN